MEVDKKDWNPRHLRRLLADVVPYHVDPGQLGEYASVLEFQGRKKADRLFPDIALHLQAGCRECQSEIESIQEIILEEGQVDEPATGEEAIEVSNMALASESLRTLRGAGDTLTPEERGRLMDLLDALFSPLFKTEVLRQVVSFEELALEEAPAQRRRLSDFYYEELIALLLKLPADERREIELQLERVFAQFAHQRERLRRQDYIIEEELNNIQSLLSAIKRQKK